MRRTIVAAVSLVVLLASCTTGTTTPTTPAGPTVPPIDGGVPTPPGTGSSNACAPYPTFSTAAPIPSFPSDAELLAKIPATIDGQPTTNAQAVPVLAQMCFYGSTSVDQVGQAFAQAGLDLTTTSFGSFGATIDGESVSVTMIRTAGRDANLFLQNLALLTQAFGGSTDLPEQPTQGNFGGKTVWFTTNDEGTKDAVYIGGDTLWGANDLTDSQATKLFGALP